ncbi:GNAT family protein [Alpinimonas psychrophila]|uniref:RimJ/RimL family protein N-acetyltransferase n=1 Tax=Alpinimonas psychrophila TaxID=748908 RepID=A0A7W3JU80_9MICO|nr:GNAT family N-acetyltransferase [Alpinimonas psychrophila]MBA8829270.1 RimJ/RimL family protein N-acetyltransferase [Alpinimonas psychrophila]
MRTDLPIPTRRFDLVSLDASFAGERYQGWLSNENVNRYLETRFLSQDGDALIAYVNQILESVHSYLFAIVARESGAHIGNIKIGPINPVHSSAAIGLVIGEHEWWGKGVATEVIGALSEWGFAELKLAKITAGSYASNRGSIKAFLTCGFRQEGLQESQVMLRTGERDDVVLLGKLNPADAVGGAGG